MFTLRCTRPLLSTLGQLTPPGEGAEPPATTALGDWYANRVNIGRHRLVLCTNELTLLSVVVPAKDLPRLPVRLLQSVGELLDRLGIPDARIERELREMTMVRFAPTRSRSVLGTMNDFAWQVEAWFEAGRPTVPLSHIELRLASCPCGALQYDRPMDRARAVLLAAS